MGTTSVMAELADIGPFFAVETHTADAVPRAPWRPMAELTRDGDRITQRVLAVRARLAAPSGRRPEAVELRVAASVVHLGLVARLISPVLALAVATGETPDVDLARTWWQPELGGAFPLSLAVSARSADAAPAGPPSPDGVGGLAAAFADRMLGGPTHELASATARMSVSKRVLWGNTSSAVQGAAAMIAAAWPELAGRARALAAALMRLPPLHGTGEVGPGGRFRRYSCCLIYRAAPGNTGPVCGDCVLASPSGVRRRGPRAAG